MGAHGLTEDEPKSLFADVPDFMWRGLAESVIKRTRWDEWQRYGLGWQADRITELAEELRLLLPDAELIERRVMPAVAARETAARAEERERIAAELQAYAEHYPEDVFLGPQPEDDQYAVMHGASGMARHIYTNVAPSIARADAPAPNGADR